jgi:outer membrane protein assembly factor BamB
MGTGRARVSAMVLGVGFALAGGPGVGGVCLIATASGQLSPLYTDDSVTAAEAMVKIQELSASGNVGEASRVTQSLLTNEGDRVLELTAGSDVFVSVRQRVHEVLRATPALLRRYRDDEQAEAARNNQNGQVELSEHSRWMTSAGLEAALRLAQQHLESARFDAAYLTLRPTENHPDIEGVKSGDAATRLSVDEVALKDAARLAITLSRYLPRADVQALASRFAARAGLEAELAKATAVAPPSRASERSVTPRDAQAEIDVSQVPEAPLAWITMVPATEEGENDEDVRFGGDSREHSLADAWVMPTLAGDVLYVNDGMQIGAWDRYTLMPLWTLRPPPAVQRGPGNDSRDDQIVQTRLIEDVSTVAVQGGIGVAVTGYATSSRRSGDARVHGFETASGRLLWSQSVPWLDRQLSDGGSIRGPALISGDTVVLCVRKVSSSRRVTSLYVVGLDLYTGEMKWLRLIGSVGMLAYQQSSRATDAAIVERGIVYRTDSLGVMCAIEATSGRVLWVKRLTTPPDPSMARISSPIAQPWASAVPVVDGETMLVIDPSTRDLLRVETATGKTLATLTATDVILPRYLVRNKDWLGCIGDTRAAFVPIKSLDMSSAVKIEMETLGRVTTSGDRFAMPVRAGVALVDPANINAIATLPLQAAGNVLLESGHAIVTDATRVQSFLTWDLARTLLQKQASARPTDPQPVLTLAELAFRAGKPEQVTAAADRVLDIADASTDMSASANARRQLFGLLWNIVESGRERLGVGTKPGGDAGPAGLKADEGNKQPEGAASLAEAGTNPAAALTLPLLDEVATRLGRAAETPTQRAWHALSVGWIAASRATKPEDATRAVEAYQSVLNDPAMSAAAADGGSLSASAGEAAEERLVAVLGRWGAGVYASFAAQAQRELLDLGPTPGARELEALAKKYPCAAVTPRVWATAADARERAKEFGRLSSDLASGLAAARRLASWGVTEGSSSAQELGRRLFRVLAEHGREGHALRLAREMPAAATGVDLSALQQSLATLNRRPRIGRVSGSESREARVLSGWTLEEPIISDGPGHATDQAALLNLTTQMVGVFGPRVEDGRLTSLWMRPFDRARQPKFVRVDWDASYVFWPAARGGTVERINTDGVSAWRTPEMRQLFNTEAADPEVSDKFDTLSGRVKTTDLLIAMDAQSLCIIERSGRGARFDLATGALKWSGRLPMNRVYDAVLVDGSLVVVGTGDETPRGRAAEAPIVVAIGAAGGDARVLGDAEHLGKGPGARWLRAIKGGVVIGLEEGITAINLADGAVRWSVLTAPLQRTADCRVLGERLFVVDQTRALRLVDGLTGEVAIDELQDRGRLRDDGQPVRLVAVRDHLLLVGPRGMVALNKDGAVVGEDATDDRTSLGTPVVGENAIAFVGGDLPPTQGELNKDAVGLRVIGVPSGRMLQSTALVVPRLPSAAWAIDDKLLVTSGQMTVVLETAE